MALGSSGPKSNKLSPVLDRATCGNVEGSGIIVPNILNSALHGGNF
jgi:hypothetical protein